MNKLTTHGAPATTVKGDAGQYELYVEYFRGQTDNDALHSPFTYRPVIPFLASLLPFSAMTSINIINIIMLLVGLYYLWRILIYFNFDTGMCMLGCLMYVVSFPSFYYGAIGYLDPVVIGLTMMGVWFLLNGKYVPVTLLILLSTVCKETMVILLPVMCVRLLVTEEIPRYKTILYTMAIGLLWAALTYAVRTLSPGTSGYMWLPAMRPIEYNVFRFRSWASFTLSFGIPGFITLLGLPLLYKKHLYDKDVPALVIGVFFALAIEALAFVSVVADGRYIWISYPFAIPLAMILIKDMRAREKDTPVKPVI